MPAEATERSAPIVSSHHTVVQGFRSHHLEAGEGPPLVLLHGTAFDSAALSYGASLPVLAQRHRVLALDWPGYGASEVPRATMAMDDYVDVLDAFPWRKANAAHERLPRSQLVVVPRCGHWVMREAADRFEGALLEFAARHA